MTYVEKKKSLDVAVKYLVSNKKTDITHQANVMSGREFSEFCQNVKRAVVEKTGCKDVIMDRDEFVVYLMAI